MSDDHTVSCECGRVIVVPCSTKRHAKAHTGYHGADQVTQLSDLMVKCIDALHGRYDWEHGLTSWGVYTEVKRTFRADERVPVCDTIRGRLSTMAGDALRLVKSGVGGVEAVDPASMLFALERQSRWWLSSDPTLKGVELEQAARERMRLKLAVVESRAR